MRGLAEIEREEFLVVDALNGADSAAQWNTLVAKRHALATEKAAYLRAHSDELRKSAAEYNWNGFRRGAETRALALNGRRNEPGQSAAGAFGCCGRSTAGSGLSVDKPSEHDAVDS